MKPRQSPVGSAADARLSSISAQSVLLAAWRVAQGIDRIDSCVGGTISASENGQPAALGRARVSHPPQMQERSTMHVQSKPAILYFGTPVVIISTLNEDGSSNIAPMSSAFWLGWRCLLGLDASSKTTQNLLRTGECVLNLPSEHQAAQVNALALTTGSDPVPAHKAKRGYQHVHAKFERAGLSPQTSDTIGPPRVRECPVQLEAVLESSHGLAESDGRQRGLVRICEVRIRRVHVEASLLLEGHADRIDPDKWRPLIMSFQQFYGLSARQVHTSALATISEALYREVPGQHRPRSACL